MVYAFNIGMVLWRELSPDLLTGHILSLWDGIGVGGLQPVLSRVQISENLLCT